MSHATLTPSGELERDVRRHLHHHWKGYAVQAVLMMAAGALAILVPFAATLASTLFFGWLLAALGLVGLVATARAGRAFGGFGTGLAIGAATLVLGLLIVVDPFAGAVALTTLLAIYFMLLGLATFAMANAFRVSGGRFWLLALAGIVNVGLALFLVVGLPGTAVWAVGLFLGISLLSSGASLLAAALRAR
ncbi:HdeD family acid-resistance protein [Aureimonas flava]|uniref:HdeD family acid-resistance protein n=1 Tax=Aureimonas flava TaxID=2320271 RepID=A0A3A1WQC2_9HYPH|nr:DUF308 domain-containing protein [Aureimonas flava]RIY02544.1 HdeD family acid-resistance protein [Aureimonas flava]